MIKNPYKFNWTELDRYSIASYMWILSDKVIGNNIPITDFHKLVSKHIKNEFPILFKKFKDPKGNKGFVSVGGTYYSDYDQSKKKCVEIIFVYHESDKSLKFTKKRFWNFCLLIADTILHEVIHIKQYRKRKFKVLPDYESTASRTKIREEQGYLGCADEIDAYGFNIACELVEKFNGDQLSIINYLNSDQKNLRRKHNSWRLYLRAFQHDHNHEIIKKLKRKVIKYIPAARHGKPFKSKDWIC